MVFLAITLEREGYEGYEGFPYIYIPTAVFIYTKKLFSKYIKYIETLHTLHTLHAYTSRHCYFPKTLHGLNQIDGVCIAAHCVLSRHSQPPEFSPEVGAVHDLAPVVFRPAPIVLK